MISPSYGAEMRKTRAHDEMQSHAFTPSAQHRTNIDGINRWHHRNSMAVLLYPLVYLTVFVFSTGINQYYSYIGYMPLDQSTIYNGAWRVLVGQVPYIDFWTPFGLIPILAQAVIFHGLGVSWTNYALQASLLNGLF